MENLKNFIEQVDSSIEAKEKEFNDKILPEVQNNYNIQETAIKAIKSILLKKSLISDDPYKYDTKMTDISIPECTNFSDADKASVLGVRLTNYEMMIEFLNNYYQFNTEFLNPKKISNLLKLNQCFMWDDFSSTVNNPNTKSLVDTIQSVLSGPDKLSAGLLRDSLSHLARTNRTINTNLKSLSVLHREKYKLSVRKCISDKIEVSEDDLTNPSKLLKEIKKIIGSADHKLPFYSDLIIELLKDDYSKESQSRQQKILTSLNSKQEIVAEQKDEVNYRPILISGLKVLGNSASQFNEALDKIKYNEEIINKEDLSTLKKFVLALKKAFNIEEKEKEISITITDPLTQIKKRQNISYNKFVNDMSKKAILFSNIVTPGSVVQQKIKQLSDEALLSNLTKHISESNELLKQMAGLDEFYKTIRPEVRTKVKGIKMEITTITNSIIKANQYRAEYTTSVEEELQMQRLGIK